MDDFQIHKQFSKNQQGIQDHQADNSNLLEEKNQHESHASTDRGARGANAALQTNTSWCPQPWFGWLCFMELSIAPTPAALNGELFHMEPPGSPPDPAWHGGLGEREESTCQSHGDCALGLVSSQGTSAPAAELLCSDRTAQLSSCCCSFHCGVHDLSALPELCPTAALLPQVPSAWVCSASPETCESWRAFSSCTGRRCFSWGVPAWSLHLAASPQPPPPPPISDSRCSIARGHRPPPWSASGTWTWLWIKLASPCQRLRDKSRVSSLCLSWPRMPKSCFFHPARVTRAWHSDTAGWREVASRWYRRFCITSPGTTRSPCCLSSSVWASLCCSTTRNFLTRYFQTSPNKASITGAKSSSPYLAPRDGGGGSCPCVSNTDPASSPSSHTAKMRNSHNFHPLTPMTPCHLSLCRQIKQVMPTFQPGRWVTLSSPSPQSRADLPLGHPCGYPVRGRTIKPSSWWRPHSSDKNRISDTLSWLEEQNRGPPDGLRGWLQERLSCSYHNPASLPSSLGSPAALAHKPSEIRSCRQHVPIPLCGHSSLPAPPGSSAQASRGPPVPLGCSPSPRLPGAAVGSAPSSGHLVTCREEGAGPTVPSQGRHLRSPPPGAERSPRGAAPGTEPPAPYGTASGLPRGPEPPADGASRTPGLPNLPRPQHWRERPRRRPEQTEPGAAAGPRVEGRGSPGRVPLSPPTPARTHRAEPREPPGRPPLPPVPVPCASRLRPPPPAAATGPPPARLRLPPAGGGPAASSPPRPDGSPSQAPFHPRHFPFPQLFSFGLPALRPSETGQAGWSLNFFFPHCF